MKRALLFALIGSAAAFGCFAKTTSLGSTEDASTSSDDAGPAPGVACGEKTCASGEVCCNPSCGICTPPGGACIQLECAPAPDGGSADGGSGSGSGIACQIGDPMLPTAPCPSGEYCVANTPGTCAAGHCATIPMPPPPGCPSLECACDGVVRCQDHSRPLGHDVAADGATSCGIPCGTSTCNGLTEYCEHASGGVALPDGGGFESWTCKPMPAACAIDHSCTCVIQNAGSGGTALTCESDKDGKVTVYFPIP